MTTKELVRKSDKHLITMVGSGKEFIAKNVHNGNTVIAKTQEQLDQLINHK